MRLVLLTASIPSPSFNRIGPLHLYGLCIALGVIAAVVLSSSRWRARGGNPDDIGTIAMWSVPAGVIGARVYHVATDWKTYQGHWIDAFKITQGGLGIPGGILFGVLTGLIVVKVKKLPVAPLLDVVAPALPIAQAIGRFGNYFNQEVFGRPTDLPWGLRIDPAYRPQRYADATTFHPTFLYEGLWNIGLALVLIRLDRTRKLPPGQLFCLYVLGYGIGRLWVENMRSDPASLVLGWRINLWMSLVVAAIALAIFVVGLRRAPAVIPESAYRAPAVADVDDAIDDGFARPATATTDATDGAADGDTEVTTATDGAADGDDPAPDADGAGGADGVDDAT